MEEGIISESKLQVRKVNSENENSDFECNDRSEGKPVQAEIDKKKAEEKKPTLALLPNRLEENEKNNNRETRDRDGIINLRRSNRIFKPPERLGCVSSF